MLNLFNIKKKSEKNTLNTNEEKKSGKHFPSSVREWNNSIYVYNKKALNLIPVTTISALNIIKSYFSLFNNKLERKMRTKRLLLRFRRLSSHKIYVSNGEFKHTNNKVLITLYLFNRQKYNYLLAIKKWYLKTFLAKKSKKNVTFNEKISKKLNLINIKGLEALKEANRNKHLVLKALNKITKKKSNLKKYKSMYEYISKFYKKLIRKSLRKIQIYLYYKQLLYINRTKFNYTYLQYLKKHLEKLYNKNVEFNLVNLKRFYLNSDILSESLTLKITKNRRKMLKFLNKLKNKVKITKKNVFLGEAVAGYKKDLRLLNSFTLAGYNKKINSQLLNYVLSNLKYRHVTGFRLEAHGRLTRRFTASRSVSKLRYKGNLLDIDSSYRGLSSVLLKGNLKSNVQFTKLNSKTRIGSFGIKGWVSGN